MKPRTVDELEVVQIHGESFGRRREQVAESTPERGRRGDVELAANGDDHLIRAVRRLGDQRYALSFAQMLGFGEPMPAALRLRNIGHGSPPAQVGTLWRRLAAQPRLFMMLQARAGCNPSSLAPS